MVSKGNGANQYERLLAKFERMDAEGRGVLISRILRERDFFESVFNSLHEGLIVVNASLNIRIINRAACGMLGISENVRGERIDRYFKYMDWENLRRTPPEEWGKLSRREMEVFYPEHRFLDLYLVPVTDRPDMRMGDLPMATLILHDVTDITETTEKNVETQRVKAITQLAAGVAHELGNPLNALGIHLQILKRKLANADDQTLRDYVAQFVEIAGQETARLDAIVKNFLNAVRPQHLELGAIDVRKIILEALAFLRPELESHGIDVKVDFPDLVPVITGDEGQLTQAVYNIVKNAIQAMRESGKLAISCTVDDVFVNLKFADTGPGLNQEQLAHVTEPYFTTKKEGTGLGLLIVDRIVRAHGGELALDSSPGKGVVVTMALPRYSRMIRQLPWTPDSPHDDIVAEQGNKE